MAFLRRSGAFQYVCGDNVVMSEEHPPIPELPTHALGLRDWITNCDDLAHREFIEGGGDPPLVADPFRGLGRW